MFCFIVCLLVVVFFMLKVKVIVSSTQSVVILENFDIQKIIERLDINPK